MSDSCRTSGNSDLYGVGVRTGIYAQWLATLLTTLFEPGDENTYRIASLIIQASIFLGLCIESRRPDAPVVGAVITQYLLVGSLSSLTGDGISHLEHLAGMVRILFYLALSAYGIWFWFVGVDGMARPGCENREIAFFGRTSVLGWFRTLGKVISCIGLALCALLLVLSLQRTVRRFRRGIREALRGGGGARKKRPQVEISLLILSMALIACSIYLVEHLIDVNEIEDVDANGGLSVGQLIPLLAGVIAGGMTVWKILVHRLFLRKRCWFLFGHHL